MEARKISLQILQSRKSPFSTRNAKQCLAEMGIGHHNMANVKLAKGAVFTLIHRYFVSVLQPFGRYKPKTRLVDYITKVYSETLTDTDEDSNQSLEMMYTNEQMAELEKMESMYMESEKQGSPKKKGKGKSAENSPEKGVKRPASGDEGHAGLKKNDSIDYKADTP